MSDTNMVILIGRIGSKVEFHEFPLKDSTNLGCLASFSLATEEAWRDKATGIQQSKTDWHKVVIHLRHSAEYASKYANIGDTVKVIGKSETRDFIEKEHGRKIYVTEVKVKNLGHDFDIIKSAQKQNLTNQRPIESSNPYVNEAFNTPV